jgi:two-component system phosphate regulon response regulator PhoB
VLIVEDDRFLRKACHDGLLRDGYDIRAAQDGEAALQAMRAGRPDVVILDWLLPKIPGVEVLRAAKADDRCRDIPIIVLSNSARDEDRRLAIELGAAAYLVKADLSLMDLRQRIRGLLKAP